MSITFLLPGWPNMWRVMTLPVISLFLDGKEEEKKTPCYYWAPEHALTISLSATQYQVMNKTCSGPMTQEMFWFFLLPNEQHAVMSFIKHFEEFISQKFPTFKTQFQFQFYSPQ